MPYFVVHPLHMLRQNASREENFRAMQAFEFSFDVRGEPVIAQAVPATENSPTFDTFMFIVRFGATIMVVYVLLYLRNADELATDFAWTMSFFFFFLVVLFFRRFSFSTSLVIIGVY